LLDSGASGDRDRAIDLLDDCARFTEAAGMRLLHQHAVELLQQ
jgi:hypothetical protein